jgi:hypothetical protein
MRLLRVRITPTSSCEVLAVTTSVGSDSPPAVQDNHAVAPRAGAHPDERCAPKRNYILGQGRPGKIWAEDAKANIMYFEAKLKLITTRNNPENGSQPRLDAFQTDAANGAPCLKSHRVLSYPEIKAMCAEVGNFLDRAERAAKGEEPRYQWFRSWWSGTSTEAAYKNLHYAEASMARLYEPAEIRPSCPTRSGGRARRYPRTTPPACPAAAPWPRTATAGSSATPLKN